MNHIIANVVDELFTKQVADDLVFLILNNRNFYTKLDELQVGGAVSLVNAQIEDYRLKSVDLQVCGIEVTVGCESVELHGDGITYEYNYRDVDFYKCAGLRVERLGHDVLTHVSSYFSTSTNALRALTDANII